MFYEIYTFVEQIYTATGTYTVFTYQDLKEIAFLSYMLKNVCDLLGDLYIATGQILHK